MFELPDTWEARERGGPPRPRGVCWQVLIRATSIQYPGGSVMDAYLFRLVLGAFGSTVEAFARQDVARHGDRP